MNHLVDLKRCQSFGNIRPFRLFFGSLIFLMVILFFLWRVCLYFEVSISLLSKGNGLYQAIVPASILEKLVAQDTFVYQNRKVLYTVESIGQETIAQNDTWYFEIWLHVEKLEVLTNQIIEVNISNERKTIFQYFQSQFRKE